MSRVAKHIALDLIQYCKTLKVTAHFWDPNAKSAYEFARQMSSPKLKKQNPAFECDLTENDRNEPANLVAEFADGSKWSTETFGYTASELRSKFFAKAAIVEDVMDDVEGIGKK